MKKNIPCTKDIIFNTDIYEINSISLEHNLKLKENEINGEFIISGDYKESDITLKNEPFIYNIPFDIDIDSKYDTSNAKIEIDDFNYEIISTNALKINIVLLIDSLVEKEEDNLLEIIDDVEEDKIEEKIKKDDRVYIEEDTKDNNVNKEVTSIFNNLTDSEDSFVTYHVHIYREEDDLDKIIKLYDISKEDLALYNDLEGIKLGSKLIIPCNE